MTRAEFYVWLEGQGITDSLTRYVMWSRGMPRLGATNHDAKLALEAYRTQPGVLRSKASK